MQTSRFNFYLTELWLLLFILTSCYAYWLFWSVGDSALLAWYLPDTWNELIQSWMLWKLITPVFIHFTEWHLMGNLFFWWYLGRIIGQVTPGWLICLTLFSGILSNLAQWWYGGNLFGGMSGIVAAVIGFLAVNEFLRHDSIFFINRILVFVYLGYLILVATGYFGVYSNAAHFVGLFWGILTGLCFIKFKLPNLVELNNRSTESSKDNK